MALPAPSSIFSEKKHRILSALHPPAGNSYTDASPKGTVDEAITPLLNELNALPGFVSTSSCAGRVSVFLEGRRAPAAVITSSSASPPSAPDAFASAEHHVHDDVDDDTPVTRAGVGGKGGGGTWLYVSHDALDEGDDVCDDWMRFLGLVEAVDDGSSGGGGAREDRLIHFKFEAMILHVLTASPAHAQLLLRCALAAGFRESGAINLLPQTQSQTQMSTCTDEHHSTEPSPPALATPIVAIRSSGLALESIIGRQVDGRRQRLVPPSHLRTLMRVANERFAENARRRERFLCALRGELALLNEEERGRRRARRGEEWEDGEARKARMREEGMRRQEEVRMMREQRAVEQGDQELVLGQGQEQEQDVGLLVGLREA